MTLKEKTEVRVLTESDMIDDLRMKGFVLKKEGRETTVEAIHRAYSAGIEAGRAYIIVEMLSDLKKEQFTPVDILHEMRHPSLTGRTYEFISRYLPKRYKQNNIH